MLADKVVVRNGDETVQSYDGTFRSGWALTDFDIQTYYQNALKLRGIFHEIVY